MTPADLESALRRLPRFPLAALPTPLQDAPNLSARLGVKVLVKRDDMTGLAMGGNKARKLEYIVADALAEGADVLLTSAAAQSNFCRMTAGAARRAGMRANLVLRGTGQEPVQGNLLLDYLFDAGVRFTTNLDPYADETRRMLEDWADKERDAGHQPYLVYIHGGSRPGALATIGYVDGALELAQQLEARRERADHLYVSVGSGGTVAGLALGLRRLGLGTRVVGVCVGALSDVVGPKTVEFADAGAALLNVPSIAAADVDMADDHRGPAYGVPTQAGLEAIELLARSEALVANPVYTGKALAALIADVRRGIVRAGETVVFMLTGGDPLVFAYADTLGAHALASRADAHRRR